MKICFPVEENKGLESAVYGHFGSAPGFVTFDTETEEAGFINNRDSVTLPQLFPATMLMLLSLEVSVRELFRN